MQATRFPASGFRRITHLGHQPSTGWQQRSRSCRDLGNYSCQPWSLGQRRCPQPKLHVLAPHENGPARHCHLQFYTSGRPTLMTAPSTNRLHHSQAQIGVFSLERNAMRSHVFHSRRGHSFERCTGVFSDIAAPQPAPARRMHSYRYTCTYGA